MATAAPLVLSPLSDGKDLIAAIDLGTHGTGIALAYPTAKAKSDLSSAMDAVISLKPGDPSTARTDKQLTALLLDPSKEHALLAFGERAREAFAELCDQTKPTQSGSYFQRFKMSLEPPKAPATRDGTAIKTKPFGSVATGNIAEAMAEVTTEKLMQRVLEFVKTDVKTYVEVRGSRTDFDSLKILWVVTIPAIWDDAGKHIMRSAAHNAGLIKTRDSKDLVLALEPECAFLASLADCAPPERAAFAPGQVVCVVDCGGGTVDITIEKIESLTPLSLKELDIPRGGPWGGTLVDKNFLSFIKELLGEENFKLLPHGTQLELLNHWEQEKRNLGLDSKKEIVSISMANVLQALVDATEHSPKGVFDKNALVVRIERANKVLDRMKGSPLELSKASKLNIPVDIAERFFSPIFSSINECLNTLFENMAAAGHKIEAIILAGGFAESRLLQQHIKTVFGPRCSRIILPTRPGLVVAAGAALYALVPPPIRSRKMAYSYGYVGAEAFDPTVHDARHKFATTEGRELCNVLYPIVHKGGDITPGYSFSKPGLIPIRSDQAVIDFEIYRTERDIVDPKLYPKAKRSVPVESLSESGFNIGIPRSERIATLSVLIGNEGRSREERKVNLSILFGSTEITAAATSAAGEKREVSMNYDV